MQRRLQYAAQLVSGGLDPKSMPGIFSPLIPAETSRELADIMADSRPVAARAMARALAEADLRNMLDTVRS